jgi:hypothetical protein
VRRPGVIVSEHPVWFLVFILLLTVLAAALLVATRRGPRVHGDPDLGRPRRRSGDRPDRH